MDCKNAREALEISFDEGRVLAPEMESHLSKCASCRRLSEELGSMEDMLASLPFEAPEGIEDRVLEAVLREQSRHNRPGVIGAMAACALISASALNFIVPAGKVEEVVWNRVGAWLPETQWLGTGQSYQVQLQELWASMTEAAGQASWLSPMLVWSTLGATVALLFVLNGICAVQVRQVNQ